MDLVEIAKIAGPTGIGLVAMVYVIVRFLGYLKHRDDDLKDIITNHLKHTNESMGDLKGTVNDLKIAIRELLVTLKIKNNNKRR